MSERENELFEEWWENEGQYNRAGGGDYEKTFAYYAWMAVINCQGYKLVPLEPVDEMIDDGEDELWYRNGSAYSVYKAMIGAVE